jgi:hypothetical protein
MFYAEALSITRLEGSRWRGGRLWSYKHGGRVPEGPGWSHVEGAVDAKAAHPTDCSGPSPVPTRSLGRVEAHEGRGVRDTSDTMTMIGVGSSNHDVSKSRQTAAS